MAVRQRVVKIGSCFVDGVLATLSEIEISLSPGIPTFDIIGLCDSSIRESRGRIVSAVRSCGYLMPKGHITVNITPAYMHKSGSGFDLPIALGILFLGQHLPYSDDIRIYAQGELALGGEVKGTPGAIMRLIEAAKSKPDIMLIPEQEINAAACAGVSCMPVKSLMDVCRIFSEDRYLPEEFPFDIRSDQTPSDVLGISSLRGQSKASEALIAACAGMHSILMLGSPGSGKTMAAGIIKGLLPEPNEFETRQNMAMMELAGMTGGDICPGGRPFRRLYSNTTAARLFGKSNTLVPGELALANNGVLFADEICEFDRNIIDMLKLPLEEHVVRICKDGSYRDLPASFLFACAGNPCRCGMYYEEGTKCRCTPADRSRYLGRLSGAFLDRIDLFTEMRSVSSPDMESLTSGLTEEDIKTDEEARARIKRAWDMQSRRFNWRPDAPKIFNGTCEKVDQDIFAFVLDVATFASEAAKRSGLSGRGYLKLMRVARTFADMEGKEVMDRMHVRLALTYKVNENAI